MAQRRMFSLAVIDTDKFLELPAFTRLLYYELGMRADDDGFIGSPKKITRMIGAAAEDLQRLIDEDYLIAFDSGVVAVTHWKQNNLIRADRYRQTVYLNEQSKLQDNNGIYALTGQDNMTPTLATTMATTMATTLEPQDRIGKDRIGKDRTEQERTEQERTEEERTEEEREEEKEYKKYSPSKDGGSAAVISVFDSVCQSLPKAGALSANRERLIANAADRLGRVSWEEYFRRVEASDFLSGRNGKWQGCTFDWLLRADTIDKVLGGQYDNRRPSPAPAQPSYYGLDYPSTVSSYDINELDKIDTLDFIDLDDE